MNRSIWAGDKMKIVVLDGYTLNPGDLSWSRLENLGELVVYDRTPDEKIAERLKDVDIVFTNKTVLTEETLKSFPKIKYIGVLATGYNVVDIDAARDLGIKVTNVPTYGTDAVAQFVFALLLELCHHVGAHNEAVQEGAWSRSPDFCFWLHPLVELKGKTMGIIGFGRIGRRTAEIAEAFGMKVLAFDLYADKKLETGNLKIVELDELLRRSDIISLHCPLTPDTKHIINKDTIGRMKDEVMIINTARGPLINEHDLAESLKCGKVSGAALDVLSIEPPEPGNSLLGLNNCIITPHIAWAPRESRARLMDIAVNNLESYLSGKPVNVVNE
jgi:glycerate dehydrogenase